MLLNSDRKYIFESKTDIDRNFPENIRIQMVKNTLDFKIFYHVPFHVYQNNPFWIASFWKEINEFFNKKNPFWSHAECALFILWKKDIVVGRIAAFIDHAYCTTAEENIGFFGFFECIEDYACADVLFQTAQDWLASKNMTVMRGPIDGRVDVGCGFLYTGFDSRPSLLSTYSPAYYVKFAERFGLKKFHDLFLYVIDLTKPLPKKLEEKAQRSLTAGVTIRPFHRLRSRSELKWWIPLFLETFSEHWGYVPVPVEEVRTRFGVKQLRWFVDASLFLVAESNESPVAYLWSTPDYNQIFQMMNGRLGIFELLRFLITQRKINAGKLHFIGIKKDFRHQNIGSLLNYEALVEMKKRGYLRAEVGWIDEQSTIAQTTIVITGATLYKKHRVFEKNLKS